MPYVNGPEYYAARAVRSLQLAGATIDPGLAAIHRRTAASYAELAEMAGPAALQRSALPLLHD